MRPSARRALVVEGDQETAEALGAFLSERGHHPLVITDAVLDRVLVLAAEHRPEVAFVDIDFTGGNFVSTLLASPELEGCRCFVVSSVSEAQRGSVNITGVVGQLTKPFSSSELLACLT